MKKLDDLLEQADAIAVAEVERLARLELKSKSKAHKFTMAMGTYFFCDKKNEILHDFKSKKLDDFIAEYDRTLKLTGEPMKFTADSEVITDW